MKKTQFKDTVRNVQKQFVSYLSIIIIAMLAVMAYLGIHFASKAISLNGTRFYSETHFRDVEIVSTLLLTDDDMQQIRDTAGVRDAEGVYQTSGKLFCGDVHQNVDIVSLTERINTPQLLEGRLPETADECAVELPILTSLELSVGDTITLENGSGELPEYLTGSEFIITGVVHHPDHAAWPMQVPGNRDVIVLPEVFDTDGCFMKALVSVEGTDGLNRFEKPYFDAVSAVKECLESLGKERELHRTDSIRNEYQAEIDSHQATLDDAKAELDDAQAELTAKRQELKDGEQELANARQQLNDLSAKLTDAGKALRSARQELDDGKGKTADAQAELDKSLNTLNDGEAQIAASKAQLDAADAQLRSSRSQLDAAEAQLRDGEEQLHAAKAELDAGREELLSTYAQIENAKSEVRFSLYLETYSFVGEEADLIEWAESAPDVDLDDPNTCASIFYITKNLPVPLDKELQENVSAFVQSLKMEDIPEAFRTALEASIPEDVTDPEAYLNEQFELALALCEEPYAQLSAAANTWDTEHLAYLDGMEQYQKGEQEFSQKSAEYQEKLALYEAGLADYQKGLAEYEQARARLDAGWAEYQTALAQLRKGQQELHEGEQEYSSKQQEYQDGLSALDDGKRQYAQGQKALRDGKAALEDGDSRYESGLAEYESGAAELAEAQADLDALPDCRWVILDVEGNASYLAIQNGVKNVSDMGITFSMVFVLVGALVIYTTVSRIVDEQRKLIGTEKALGLFNREILVKYLFYGVSGTFLGTVLGLAAGYFGIQRIMLYTYGRYYVFGAGASAFRPVMTAVIFGAAIALSGLTVWIACTNLIRTTAVTLLQGTVPRTHRNAGKSRKSSKSLYSRLVWLNMMADKKRVAVSIVSIAGCCALLVAGFTMKLSVTQALDRQFDEIELYDLRVAYYPDSDSDTRQTILSILREQDVEWTELSFQRLPFTADGKLYNAELMCSDISELNQFFAMRDIHTNEVLSGEGDGVWIHKRTAEKSGLKAGDPITLYDSTMNPHTVKVAGIFNIFAGRQMIISKDSYLKAFGTEPVSNMFLIRQSRPDDDSLAEQLMETDGVEELTNISELRKTYQSYASVLNLIALMFTGIAGMMAYFILLNSVNMYVNQKQYELIIMRVNGFTVREVLRYVSMELVISTLAGIVVGWGAGSVLAYRVIRLLESSQLQFVRSIQGMAWLWAALITIVFSAAISFLALRKIPRLKLTDAA